MITRKAITEEYLDFMNNYLTVEKFAEHRGMTTEEMQKLLWIYRNIFNSDHPEA